MNDPLQQQVLLDKFDGVQEVVRTVHVQAEDREYRIEIYREYGRKSQFTADLFVKHQVPNPELNIEGETLDAFLRDGSLPWVAKETAEEALKDALDFLENRHPRGKKQSASATQGESLRKASKSGIVKRD